MIATLRTVQRLALIAAIVFIAGCANMTRARGPFIQNNPDDGHWQGRLALKVHGTPAQAFTANFELQGNAQAGLLSFFTPLGSTAARLQWDAAGAQLQTNGEPQQFASLDALTLYTTGASLPVTSLFAWLKGNEPVTPGWQVDLRELPTGRLRAQRMAPDVPADLTIILDQ
ncbi:MAG: lipoprotein insertase outer membrane protein LolB [Pseudomonadota bacterium]